MKTEHLTDMVKGWFVGNFEPTLYRTGDVEVAVKHYGMGDFEGRHYHKLATEITVIISGAVKMNGIEYHDGDIIIMEPGEDTDFFAVTDSVSTVVKIPGACNDKYTLESGDKRCSIS